jgi:hypothetical protein
MTSRKARARQALRWGKHYEHITGIVFPPSVTIAYANNTAPDMFPLLSRREWRRKAHR